MSGARNTGTRLDPIVESVRARQAALGPLTEAVEPDPARVTRFTRALRGPGLSFIAECKRRSPSAGDFGATLTVAERAAAYADAGADALSILTEADHFGGHPEDLAAAGGAGIPRLRKDFLLGVDMVKRSVRMGADAVLLLAVCLDDAELTDLRDAARDLGLAVLLEVHDEAELDRALRVQPDCVGVNARDLRTFEVDLAVAERLLPLIPAGHVRVAESGIRCAADAARMAAAGADAVLVGEALMRAPDPGALLAAWREGRDLGGARR
ncbi:MAG: indole-3-glycerol-phosphate synthase [Planctomycetota bacterium]|nr:indole-3-glycerol-phosphate synthase [Planctomycetota bacterium]